jgi:predicted nucleic acid-binding protein
VIVVDTSFAYALLDRSDSRHDEAAGWYDGVDEDLVTTPLAVAEIDHLASGLGADVAAAFRRDLVAGAYAVEWDDRLLRGSVEVADRYADLGIGLTDASLVCLAERLSTDRIASFDERHFRAVRPLSSSAAFQLLPLDA